MEIILITGGAGYIGSRLVPELLKQGYGVKVLDNFMYGQNSLLDCCDKENFEIIRGDCRDEKVIEKAMKGADVIIPLAAKVGFPICDQDTVAAITTNLDAIKTILRLRDQKQKIVYPCFPAGTKILTLKSLEFINQFSKEYRTCDKTHSDNIESIKIGDKVLSYDEKTGAKEFKTVTKTFVRNSFELMTIKFSNGNEIVCTPEHPFAVDRKGSIEWIEAQNLRKRDKCIQYQYHGLHLRLKNLESRGKKVEEINGEESGKRQRDSHVKGCIREININKESIEDRHKRVLNKLESYITPTGQKRSEETKKNMSKSKKEKFKLGLKVWNDGLTKSDSRVSDWHDKCMKTRLERIRSGEIIVKIPNWFNGSEKKVSYHLRVLCPGQFKYNGDSRVMTIVGYSPDFVNVNGQKKCIEMYGCRWHGCETCAKGVYNDKQMRDKDEKRIAKIGECGWQTLIIWEHELKDSTAVREKINNFVYNPNVEMITVESVNRKSVRKEKVYNLEVEDNNNYFAYGILVHNCTNSGYGLTAHNGLLAHDKFCTEETPLNPISLYGTTKVNAERSILEAGNALSFRLATVFGASNRMRTDLLVNDFVYRAINDSAVVVFGGHATRNYIHILDVVDTFIYGIKNWESMKDNVYNVGLSSANLSKLELCEKIKKHLPKFVYMEAEIGEDPDKRDYCISNSKLENTGWSPRRSLDDGIIELIKAYQIIRNNKYGNV